MKMVECALGSAERRDLIVKKHRSANGLWTVEMHTLIFTRRVILVYHGYAGHDSPSIEFSYCAGVKHVWQLALYNVLVSVMEGQPDGVTPGRLRDFLPDPKVKPVGNEPPTWEALWKLSGREGDAAAMLAFLNGVPVSDADGGLITQAEDRELGESISEEIYV